MSTYVGANIGTVENSINTRYFYGLRKKNIMTSISYLLFFPEMITGPHREFASWSIPNFNFGRILNIDTLLDRVVEGMEVIIATNPSVEGETTALYLSNILGKKGASVTKLARGVPVGSDLEYVDEATLIRAMEGRVSV